MKPLPYDKVKQLIPGMSTFENSTGESTFYLEERVGSFIISGVPYRERTYTWEVKTDTLLEKKSLAKLISQNLKGGMQNEYHVLPAPLYHALFKALYTHKDDAVCKASIAHQREKLENLMHDCMLLTLSKVEYYVPGQQDSVLHYIDGVTPQIENFDTICGVDGFITEIAGGNVHCAALLDDPDIQKVTLLYQWLTKKAPFAFRQNRKHSYSVQRGVTLSGPFPSGPVPGFNIGAIDTIENRLPALGVREVRT